MSHSTHDIDDRYSTAPLTSTSATTKDVAKDQAAAVGQEAKASGQHVAEVAKDQASSVVGETTRQAKDLLTQGRSELANQVSTQHQRATSGLSSIAAELRDLVDGKGGSGGTATSLVSEASDRLSSAVTWLETREPRDLVNEVTTFARRRPGTFLALAAGVGLLAGRLTRGAVAAGHDETASPVAHRAEVPTESHGVAPDDLTGVASADVLADPGLRVAR